MKVCIDISFDIRELPTSSRFKKALHEYLKSRLKNSIQKCDPSGRTTSQANRPFSYSEKESRSNDTLLHFVEFSNVHNSDRSSSATRSNLAYKNA